MYEKGRVLVRLPAFLEHNGEMEMKSSQKIIAKTMLGLAVLAGVFGMVVLAAPGQAQADPHGSHHHHYVTPHYHVPQYFHVPHYHVPHYHAPSLHFHRTYHHDYDHWTPQQGWHSHGHYHYTPHYTPGHLHW
jgi:hypothetical protein